MRKRSAGRGCLIAFVVLLAILGGLTAAIVGLVNSVDVKTGGTSGPAKIIPDAIKPKPAPKGLGAGSLVRQDNFTAALTQIRTKGGGRLTHLRVAPDRIDAQLLTGAGRLRSVQVKPGGTLERFGPDSGAGFDQSTTIPFARLNPAAPQRLARAGRRADRRAGRDPAVPGADERSTAGSCGPPTSPAGATCSATPQAASSASTPDG